MNNQELDVLAFGASMGLAGGTWLGWHLRKAIYRMREQSVDRARVKSYVSATRQLDQDARKLARSQASVPSMRSGNVIPLKRKVPQEFPAITGALTSLPDAEQNEEHTDVVAALVNAGYKRSVAKAAVDACSPDERTTVEQWTVAALKKASTK